jgi:hypothetical protein
MKITGTWNILSASRILLFLLPVLAQAQWFKITTPGIPRTADGKPNLSAPAPRRADGKPDLSGIWMAAGAPLQDLAWDKKVIPIRPEAEAIFKLHQQGIGAKDDPAARCIPTMPKLNVLPYPFKLVDVPGMLLMLHEGFTTYRQIFTDGRALPKDPQPTFLGYSVGHWEGDDLVVETNGISHETFLDNAGRPHTDDMRLTERFRRKDFGHLEMELTFDDPKFYSKPWTVLETARLLPDTELLEYICDENNRSLEHLK